MPGSGSGREEAFVEAGFAHKRVDPRIHAFDSLPVPVALIEARRQRVVHANRAFEELAGCSAGMLQGSALGSVLPGLCEGGWIHAVDSVVRDGRAARVEEVALMAAARAGTRWWDFTFVPLHGSREGGEPMIVVSAVEATTRLSQRLHSEEVLRQFEGRSEKALREADHRARNSLQLVVALLGLQSSGISLPEERARFSEATRRVAVIAEAHVHGPGRSRRGTPGRIDLADYLHRICLRMAEGDPVLEARISLDATVDPAPIQVERAAPLGLLVHEVVAGILLQRSRLSSTTAIRIRLDPLPGRDGYRLTLLRSGPPAEGSGTAPVPALGRQFVPALAEQVGCLVEEEDERTGLLVITIPA